MIAILEYQCWARPRKWEHEHRIYDALILKCRPHESSFMIRQQLILFPQTLLRPKDSLQIQTPAVWWHCRRLTQTSSSHQVVHDIISPSALNCVKPATPNVLCLPHWSNHSTLVLNDIGKLKHIELNERTIEGDLCRTFLRLYIEDVVNFKIKLAKKRKLPK